MIHTAASHQGATEAIRLHFGGAVVSSIFTSSLCRRLENVNIWEELQEKIEHAGRPHDHGSACGLNLTF